MSDYQNIEQAYSLIPVIRRTRFYDTVQPTKMKNNEYLIRGRYALDGTITNFSHFHSNHPKSVPCSSDMDTHHGQQCDRKTGRAMDSKICNYDNDCEAGFRCMGTAPGIPKQCLLEKCTDDSDSSSGVCNKSDFNRGIYAPFRAEPIRCSRDSDCESGLCSDRGYCTRMNQHPLVLHAKYRGMYGAGLSSAAFLPTN